MNTTDLLLQMTLAATQIAQNTACRSATGRRMPGPAGLSTLLAEKRVEAAGTETGRAVSESQRVRFRLRPMGVRSARGAQSVPQAPGLEELFRSLLMGAQAAPRVTHPPAGPADCGSRHGPGSGCGGRRGRITSPGSRPPEGSSSRYWRSRRLRVRRSPRSRRRSFLQRRMAVQPRPRRLSLRPGRAARRPGGRWRDGGPAGPRGAGAA